MQSLKNDIKNILLTITQNIGENYPKQWDSYPIIRYLEAENRILEFTDMKESKALVRYRLDIWAEEGIDEEALKIDEAMSATGLVRCKSQDQPEQNEVLHKVMYYEGIMDHTTKLIYHTDGKEE